MAMDRINRDSIIGSGITKHYNQEVVLINDFRDIHHSPHSALFVEGFLFSVITSGTAQVKIDEQTLTLKKGDIFGCMPHKVLEESMFSMDFDAITMFLSPNFALEVNRIIKIDWSFRMMATSNEIIHMQDDELEQIVDYLHLVSKRLACEETSFVRESIKQLIGSMGYALINIRARQGAIIPQKTYTAAENIIHRFAELINDGNRPIYNVNEYAEMLSITPKYFSNICKQKFGKTASRIIQEETLRRAQHMLEDSSLSIKQIASELSFKNQSHFGRYFRQHMGMTPQQFRSRKE